MNKNIQTVGDVGYTALRGTDSMKRDLSSSLSRGDWKRKEERRMGRWEGRNKKEKGGKKRSIA